MNARILRSLCLLTLATAAPAAPGDVDTTYGPSLSANSHSPAVQPDGRVVLGGGYTAVNGVSRGCLAQFTPAGALETGYNPSGGPSARAAYSIQVHPDGGVLAGGSFSTMSGVTQRRLARISAAGSLDPSFNLNFSHDIYTLELLPDGAVLVGGIFVSIDGTPRNSLARLHSNGTLDATFNPNVNGNVRSIVSPAGGTTLLAGNFTSVGGVTQRYVARLNAAGGLDTSFAPVLDGPVYAVALQADGKLLLGGAFSFVGSQPRNRVARLHADGTLDLAFNPGANTLVRGFAVQADGKIIMGGDFTLVAGQTRNCIARVHGDGTLDTSFNPNANDNVLGVTLQADGRVLAGGNFTVMGGLARNYYARLLNDPATDALTVTSPGRVEWMRGGTTPEAIAVKFELSPGGGAWSPLNGAARIPGGWAATSPGLPASGLIRARANVRSGYGNGTASLIERTVPFSFSGLELWRYAHFGTVQNTGNAANNADPDKDGLENLVEFAFGLNPNTPDAAALPQWQLSDDDYTLAFTRPAGVSGITYVGEYSTSLAPGSWTPAENVGPPPAYTFLAPATTQRLYLRVRVTVP